MERKVLVTGGVRSGKSRFAITTALAYPRPRVFLATAEPLDEEMQARIVRHQAERKDQFLTIEEPVDVSERILRIDFNPSVLVIDCLTLWLGNLFHRFRGEDLIIQDRTSRFLERVKHVPYPMILITNEIGLGVIPDQALGRRFVDALGMLNQDLARICDDVVLMSCGIPRMIKGDLEHAKVADSISTH